LRGWSSPVANVKITSYVDALQREQDAITKALNDAAMAEAEQANLRLNQGVAGAEAARPSQGLADIAQPPPMPNPPTAAALAVNIKWLNDHILILAECVLELVKGHATGPKKEGDTPKLNG
jgi:hypothetical protein